MASPIKFGLEYYSQDVDFFDDVKILKLEERHGLSGSYLTIRILSMIYRDGYFMIWDEDMPIIIAKKVGNGITSPVVNDIVKSLLEFNFFDADMFKEHNILTSRGIQKRWQKVTKFLKRTGKIKPEFLLINHPEDIENDTFQVDKTASKNEKVVVNSVMTGLIQEETTLIQEETTLKTESIRQMKRKEKKEKEKELNNSSLLFIAKNCEKQDLEPSGPAENPPVPRAPLFVKEPTENSLCDVDDSVQIFFTHERYAEARYLLGQSYGIYKSDSQEVDLDRLYKWGMAFNRFLAIWYPDRQKTLGDWRNHFPKWLNKQEVFLDPDMQYQNGDKQNIFKKTNTNAKSKRTDGSNGPKAYGKP